MTEIEEYKAQAAAAMKELVQTAKLVPGQIVVVGCSTSEVTGHRIGSFSAQEVGEALFEGIQSVLSPLGLFLAAQCCEHLNRAIVVERMEGFVHRGQPVNVVPQPKAGGSFATAAYHGFAHPMVLEHIHADAGLDIGGTLIGMHLIEVAVPVRLEQNHIGKAAVLAARVRPKFIGGERAVYDERLK